MPDAEFVAAIDQFVEQVWSVAGPVMGVMVIVVHCVVIAAALGLFRSKADPQ